MLGTRSAISTSTPSPKEIADYAKLGIVDTVIVSEPAPWIEDRAAPAAQWLAELG
jgi:hypothetical protein